MLGPLEVVDGQDRPLPVGRSKLRVLLAMLALQAHKVVSRDEIVAGLWGENPPVSAKANLSNYISELRKLTAVETHEGGYRLPVQDTEIDAREFERLAVEGRKALDGGRIDVAVELLARAQELWRGPVMAGLAVPDVVAPEVARLDALRDLVAEDAAKARLKQSPEPGPPRQLPAGVSAFTGRSAELARLDAVLAQLAKSETMMLSAIVGSAGTGKTALAVQWAHDVADRFPDGQLYADLRGYGTHAPSAPLEVLTSFLRAFGRRDDQIPADELGAAAAFRSAVAGKRMLLILDNAETAEQVRPLLPGSRGCLVLVTSRSRLTSLVALDGADLVAIEGLDPRDTNRLLTRILGEDKIRAESEAATVLGELCAHLPLALRLAAARVASTEQTLAGYVAELSGDARLDMLAVDEQPSTVRAMFDASYRPLADDVQRLFRLLSLIPGQTFTERAAAALLDVPREVAARLIGRLVAASIVDRRGVDRYSMHDLLSVYARERAAADTPTLGTARPRLFGCYLRDTANAVEAVGMSIARERVQPAETCLPDLRFPDHADALAWLDAHLANLAAAAAVAAEHGPRAVAWQLADQLRGYFWLRRCRPEWLAVATAAVKAATTEGDLDGEIVARHCLGDAHWSTGQYKEATANYEFAIAACRRVNMPERHSGLLINLGAVCREQGELDNAATHLREALRIKQDNGLAESVVHTNLGVTYQEMGLFEDALREHTRVIELSPSSGITAERAFSLTSLGATYRAMGRADLAISHVTESLALHREAGNRAGETNALEELAAAVRDTGDLPAALSYAGAAAELAQGIGNPRADVATTLTLASVHLRLGNRWDAVRGYELGLDAARRNRIRYAEVEALIGLAAAKRIDAPDEAAELATAAFEEARQCGFRQLEASARELLDK